MDEVRDAHAKIKWSFVKPNPRQPKGTLNLSYTFIHTFKDLIIVNILATLL